MGHEGVDEGVDIAFEGSGEVIEGEVDTVIGDAVLGVVVGADAFVAFAGADLGAAFGGVAGIFLGDFLFEQA